MCLLVLKIHKFPGGIVWMLDSEWYICGLGRVRDEA